MEMNRKQRRQVEKEEGKVEASGLKVSKLQKKPMKVLIGCVGADDDGCNESVFLDYKCFKSDKVLFESLQEVGWFLGVTEVVAAEEDSEAEGEAEGTAEEASEIVHSVLCPYCAEEVLDEPAPDGIEDVIDPTTSVDVVEE